VANKVVLRGDEKPIPAARYEPYQAFSASLVQLNFFAGRERRHHYSIALDVGQSNVKSMFRKKALIKGHPKRSEAAANCSIADGNSGELFVLC